MAYAILRTTKLKSFGEIGASLAHTFRDRETHNADPSLTPLNETWGAQTSPEALNLIRERLPEKYRSDAVLCIEYLVARSPHWIGDDKTYFENARAWLVERHGQANVVSAQVHRDETTPHMAAYVVPRDGEKLNAKKWLGGKAVLSEMQTDFWEKVGRDLGLERGIEGSVAQHQTVKEFYATVKQAKDVGHKIEFPKQRGVVAKGLVLTTFEDDPDFAGRVASAVLDQVGPTAMKGLQYPAMARREREQAREVERLKKQLQHDQQRWAPLEKAFRDLTAAQVSWLVQSLESAAAKLKQSGRVVIGWLQDIHRSEPGHWNVVLRERESGREVTVQSDQIAKDLHATSARRGDLVAIEAGRGRLLSPARSKGAER